MFYPMALQCLALLYVREMKHCRGIGQNKVTTKRSKTTSGTIHLKRLNIFTIFDPYPPLVGSFSQVSIGKLAIFLNS